MTELSPRQTEPSKLLRFTGGVVGLAFFLWAGWQMGLHLRSPLPTAARAIKPVVQAAPAWSGTDAATLDQILQLSPGNVRLRALHALATRIDAAALHGFLDRFQTAPEQIGWNDARFIFLSRWAELDPHAALAWAKNWSDHLEHAPAINYQASFEWDSHWRDATPVFFRLVGAAWAAKDADGALMALPTVKKLGDRAEAMLGAFDVLARQNAPDAFARLLKLPPSRMLIDDYARVFSIWAQRNPAAALSAALPLPLSRLRDAALQAVALEWALRNPTEAFAKISSVPTVRDQIVTLPSVLGPWAMQDPPTAAKLIPQISSSGLRLGLSYAVARSWALTDPAAALAWVDRETVDIYHDFALPPVLSEWSLRDPAAVGAYITKLPKGSARTAAILNLATIWPQRDLAAGLAWLQPLQADFPSDLHLLAILFKSASKSNPQGVVAYLLDHQEQGGLHQFAKGAGEAYAEADLPGMLAEMNREPLSLVRAAMLVPALAKQALGDPQAAWQSALNLPLEFGRDAAMSNIIDAWSERDPVAASKVVADIQDDRARTGAMNSVMTYWMAIDLDPATDWMVSLPPSPTRDQWVQSNFYSMPERFPSHAFAWANTLINDADRFRLLQQAIGGWAKRDPAAAKAAVPSARLNANQRASLLKLIDDSANKSNP